MEKFYRIKNDSIFGGVCTGVTNYFNIPNWTWVIRLLFILFITNTSIIIYILMIILTEEKEK